MGSARSLRKQEPQRGTPRGKRRRERAASPHPKLSAASASVLTPLEILAWLPSPKERPRRVGSRVESEDERLTSPRMHHRSWVMPRRRCRRRAMSGLSSPGGEVARRRQERKGCLDRVQESRPSHGPVGRCTSHQPPPSFSGGVHPFGGRGGLRSRHS